MINSTVKTLSRSVKVYVALAMIVLIFATVAATEFIHHNNIKQNEYKELIFNDIKQDKNSLYLILLITLFLFLFLFIFVYRRISFYQNSINATYQEQLQCNKNYLQTIFDATPNIMMTTDGREVDRANQAMLNFFACKTLEEFKSENSCICDFFLSGAEFVQAKMGELTWLQFILQNKTKYIKFL